jgi:general secretion pathway protein N
MKKLWPLVALGIGAYLLFALITLPAGVVLAPLKSSGIEVAGVSGTAWKGHAQALQIQGTRLGSVEWNLHVLSLFTARLTADVKLTRTDGFAQTELTLKPGGGTSFKDLSASLPLSALPPNVIPGGWAGTLNARLAHLGVEHGWPRSVDGTIEAVNITGPARKPANMGSYKVTFPAKQDAAADTLTGALTDTGGPLQVTGTVQLKPDRSYVIEGLIATRADAPSDVVNALQYLGPADPQGRRPFSFAGTL